jgi:hypothetical protein
MDMKKLLNIVSGNIEKTKLTESYSEMPQAPMTPPVTMNVSLNAQGIDQIKDLLGLMHRAEGSMTAPPMQMPMALPAPKDDNINDIVKIAGLKSRDVPAEEDVADGHFGDATTAPDEKYGDMDDAVPNGDDLHRKKGSYKAIAGGDNPMAIENIRAMLDARYKQIKEGKEKPDFLDVDKDGDKKEPMKKALKDKGTKPKKGEVPPQFKKNVKEGKMSDMHQDAQEMTKAEFIKAHGASQAKVWDQVQREMTEGACSCNCGKSPCESCGKDHHDVTEGWDDMMKAVKDKSKPQPNGGAGTKKGRAYGGAAQKDEPAVAAKKKK